MDIYNALCSLAADTGFTCHARLDVGKLCFLPDVREMCEANRCHSYAKSWSCPPACGTLEEITEKVKSYSNGILVQSTVDLEDSFDYEGIQAGMDTHRKRFQDFYFNAKKLCADVLPMSAGACKLCEKCTYPDAPCRNPEQMATSMEAYGLFVSRVCEDCNVKYYYGPNTVTYVSCILYN